MSSCCNKSKYGAVCSVKIEKYDRFYLAVGILLMLSEIWKQYTLTYVLNGGEYQWSYIPFQLCSVPMYLCLYLGLSGLISDRCSTKCKSQTAFKKQISAEDRNGQANSISNIGSVHAISTYTMKNPVSRACMVFLADYTLMSGVVTFLDTSGLHYGYAPLTIHSYLWHIIIAGIGVYSGLNLIRGDTFEDSERESRYSTRGEGKFGSCGRRHLQKTQQDRFERRLALSDFIPASCIFLICCGIAELINLSLDRYGIVNMFYINPHYYVNQIVFNDLAHIIPNNLVIVIYILCAMLAAFIVHLVWIVSYRLSISGAGKK